MKFQIRCANPQCGKVLEVMSDWAGRQVGCSFCKKLLMVPQPPKANPTAAPASVATPPKPPATPPAPASPPAPPAVIAASQAPPPPPRTSPPAPAGPPAAPPRIPPAPPAAPPMPPRIPVMAVSGSAPSPPAPPKPAPPVAAPPQPLRPPIPAPTAPTAAPTEDIVATERVPVSYLSDAQPASYRDSVPDRPRETFRPEPLERDRPRKRRKKKKKAPGRRSAAKPILILLGLALLGVAGFFIWQSFKGSGGGQFDKAAREKELAEVEAGPFADIDRHALNAPSSVEGSVPSLATYLVQPAKTDKEKARAIYRWITSRIAYDVPAFKSGDLGDQSTSAVLRRRICVCQGYANLFQDLCKEAKLEAAIVAGYSKKPTDVPGTKLHKPDHAWSAVKLDGEWRLVDATWGAGMVDGDKFTKRFNSYYFLTPPDELIYTHMPEEERWQLRPTTITLSQFENMPIVPSMYFQYGVSKTALQNTFAAPGFRELATIFIIPSGERPILHDVPLRKHLRDGETYHFKVGCDKEVSAMAISNNKDVHPLSGRERLFEGSVVARKGELNLMLQSRAEKDRYTVVMKYVVE